MKKRQPEAGKGDGGKTPFPLGFSLDPWAEKKQEKKEPRFLLTPSFSSRGTSLSEAETGREPQRRRRRHNIYRANIVFPRRESRKKDSEKRHLLPSHIPIVASYPFLACMTIAMKRADFWQLCSTSFPENISSPRRQTEGKKVSLFPLAEALSPSPFLLLLALILLPFLTLKKA